MPANTTPDNIVYPVAGDKIAPLRGWFSQLASSVQAALTALRAEAVQPPLPDPRSEKGAEIQTVDATTWANLPGIASVTLNLTKPCWVTITVGAWVVATAGDTRVSANVTGATTLAESQLEVGGVASAWGQVIYTDSSTATRQSNSTRMVRLNAGQNVISLRAYKGGAGVNQANYTTLQVSPIRWA